MQGGDLNPRPSGYEPDELPDCSTLQQGGYEIRCHIKPHASQIYCLINLCGVILSRGTILEARGDDSVEPPIPLSGIMSLTSYRTAPPCNKEGMK